MNLGGAADPIRHAAPEAADPIGPAGVPGAGREFKTHGTPTLGLG
jgi:hypothetical protein